MKRRNFVRTLLAAAAAPKLAQSQQAKQPLPAAAPVPWFIGLNPRTPLPHTQPGADVAASQRKFFSLAQMETLTRLCEVLMPARGDKPGAVEAGTPGFLDFLLFDSASDRQKLYSGGLDWLESEAQQKHEMPFAKLSDDQAGALLQPWLRTWMTDHPPTEPHTDFVNVAHDDIRSATINSRAWNTAPFTGIEQRGQQGLYWSPIEPDVDMLYEQPHVAANPRLPNSMPVYKR